MTEIPTHPPIEFEGNIDARGETPQDVDANSLFVQEFDQSLDELNDRISLIHRSASPIWRNLYSAHLNKIDELTHEDIQEIIGEEEITSVIRHRAQEINENLTEPQDLVLFTNDILLIAKLGEYAQFNLENEKDLSLLLAKIVDMADANFTALYYVDIDILSRASGEFAALIPESTDIDVYIELRNRLNDLSERSFQYLSDQIQHEFQSYETIEDRQGVFNNVLFEGEPEILAQYTINETDSWVWFSSAGIRITDYSPALSRIDFTPYGITQHDEIDPFLAMAMGYRGIKNYFHAIDRGIVTPTQNIFGDTNGVMARMASRFGFDIYQNGEALDPKKFNSKIAQQLKSGTYDQSQTYKVEVSLKVLREKLKEFEEKDRHIRLMKYFTNIDSNKSNQDDTE